MMKRVLFLLLFCCTTTLHAQTKCTANSATCSTPNGTITLTMTIGRVIQLAISPTSTTLTAPTTAIYNAGFAATTGPTATVASNAGWTLYISSSTATWTGIDTGTEPAWKTKPSTDLQWSTSSNGTFAGITTTTATVTSGTATAGTAASIFYRTLYSWTQDTPGNYSLQVVFTITSP